MALLFDDSMTLDTTAGGVAAGYCKSSKDFQACNNGHSGFLSHLPSTTSPSTTCQRSSHVTHARYSMQKPCCASACHGNAPGPAGSQAAPHSDPAVVHAPCPSVEANGQPPHADGPQTLTNPIWLLGQLVSLSKPSCHAHPWWGKTSPASLTGRSVKGSLTNRRIIKVGKDLLDHQVQSSTQHHHAC